MSLEMGLSIGLPLISFIFIYMSTNEDQIFIKWTYRMIGILFIIASFDIFRRLATAGAMSAEVIGMFEVLVNVMIGVFVLLIFIMFLLVLKEAVEMWLPKKKSFSRVFK